MSRLARITQLLFGTGGNVGTGGYGAAAGGNTATELATSSSLATIMGTSQYAAGWLGATLGASKFPAIEDMNAMDYLLSSQIAYILQQGVPEYDAGTTYWQKNIVCKPGTYQLYGSVTDSNTGNALTSTANWLFLGDLSTLANPSHFYSGGVTAGSAAAQTLATLTPSGFALANDGSTIACTAGFACPGAFTMAAAGTTATAVKIWNGSAYVNPAVNQFLLDETIFLTVNATLGFYVLTDAPTLGTVAPLNLDTTNFTSSAGNLAAGSGLLSTIGGAPLASPAFTGTPSGPTAAVGTNTTQFASTAFVHAATLPNVYQAQPSNPPATTSTTGLMVGLAGAITPIKSGNVVITISGTMNPSGGDGTVQIRTGTGSAPANGASLTGTARGNIAKMSFTGSITTNDPFSLTAIVAGLTLGTAIWMDLDALSTSAALTLTNISISAFEL